MNYRELFEGKRVTVMGLGLLGRGLNDTLFLIESGAEVTVTDLKPADRLEASLAKLKGLPVKLKLGGHDIADFVNTDMVLRNADVPRSSPFLKAARDAGVPVEMDESLFAKHFKGMIIGVTGTRGKTTTTTMIFNILAAHRTGVFLSGNIMGSATLPLLARARENDIVVLELSSWQLQGFHDAGLSPGASVFTNIYPDHLNRYSGMSEYIDDKKAVFLYQRPGDFCVFNGDQSETSALASEAPAETLGFRISDLPDEWSLRIPGAHNRANAAAALIFCRKLGVPDEIIRRELEVFGGVEHRLERVGEARGVEFINDSTSTTPAAGCAALDAFPGRRILLIAGGAAKNLDLTPFAEKAASRADKIALLQGTATDDLRYKIEQAGGTAGIVGLFGGMNDAVEALMSHAKEGDLLMLSPGCASFGLFENEFHRGESFVKAVKRLQG